MNDTAIDLLIIGGGLAGLSLARELIRRDCRLRVLVVEPRQEYTDDRTWCFWEGSDHSNRDLVSRTWERWRSSRLDRSVSEYQARGQSYQYVRSIDFYQQALSTFEHSSNVRLQLGSSVQAIEPGVDGFRVRLNHDLIRARWVIDTRPPPRQRMERSKMFQCFVGREIEVDAGIFDPGCIELMTDMTCDRNGVLFTYVLPFSPQRALVEPTRFSPHPVDREQLERDFQDLLRRRGWRATRVVRKEHGILPMGLPPTPPTEWPGYVRGGTGGGGLRMASGFGFLRIQKWARGCADALTAGDLPHGHPPDPWGQRVMDELFLKVLRFRPDMGPRMFERMMSATDPSVFVRFMSDSANWGDRLQVVRSLPTVPFIRALLEAQRASRLSAA